MVGPRLLVLKYSFYWETVISDGPHVLRPSVTFLNAGEPTADALLQQHLGDCALKDAYTTYEAPSCQETDSPQERISCVFSAGLVPAQSAASRVS